MLNCRVFQVESLEDCENCDLPEAVDNPTLCFMIAVREIQTRAVHAGFDELADRVHVPTARAHRADNLRLAVAPDFGMVDREAGRQDRHVLGFLDQRLTWDENVR